MPANQTTDKEIFAMPTGTNATPGQEYIKLLKEQHGAFAMDGATPQAPVADALCALGKQLADLGAICSALETKLDPVMSQAAPGVNDDSATAPCVRSPLTIELQRHASEAGRIGARLAAIISRIEL